ncbi:hypothetical protein ACJJTC_001255 [Scirpophaga incertulas]
MSGDQNISEELDRAIWRLVKLAMQTTDRSHRPLPKRWAHLKLLELFMLMEKSLEKKKRHIVEDRALKALCKGFTDMSDYEDNYNNVLDDDSKCEVYSNENVSVFGDIIRSPSLVEMEYVSTNVSFSRQMFYNTNESFLSRDEMLIDCKVNVDKPREQNFIAGDRAIIVSNSHRYKYKKNHMKRKRSHRNHEIQIRKIKRSKIFSKDQRNETGDKTKVSDTNIGKKTTKERYGYNFLTKTCNESLSMINVLNDVNFENVLNLQESISKPILGSMKELTDSEVDNKTSFNDGNLGTIAMTKESCIIDIITESTKETVALRRTLGTDAETDFKQENNLGSLSNMLKVNSVCNISCRDAKDVLDIRPKFMQDLSEPSTSKGVKHFGMDVQCGPDYTEDYAIINNTSSFTKVSRELNAALKFCNSKINPQEILNKHDCGTCISDNDSYLKTIMPRVRPTGITIKDSNTMITHNFLNETQKSEQSLIFPSNANSTTTIVKEILTMCNANHSGTGDQIESNLQIDLLVCKKEEDHLFANTDRLKLCRGIIYVHSYKDKHINEDVIYQGEWQRYIPKFNGRKRGNNPYQTGKKIAAFNREIKLGMKENIPISVDNKLLSKKSRSPNSDIKSHVVNQNNNMKPTKYVPLPLKSMNSKSEAESKCSTKLIMPKRNIKKNFVSKKPTKTLSTDKKDTTNWADNNKNHHLPLYLKRKSAKPDTQQLCNLISKEENLLRNNRILKQKNFQNLPKFNLHHRKNINYMVFRNEIELKQNCSTDCESPKSKVAYDHPSELPKTNNAKLLKESASSSQNGTHKIHTTKITCKRNLSGLSNKSNCLKNVAENSRSFHSKCNNAEKSIKKSNKENVLTISNKNNNLVTMTNTLKKNPTILSAHISSEILHQPTTCSRQISQSLSKSNVRKSAICNLNDINTTKNEVCCSIAVKQSLLEMGTMTLLDVECLTTPTSSLVLTTTKTSDCNIIVSNINEMEHTEMVSMGNENCSKTCMNMKKVTENDGTNTYEISSAENFLTISIDNKFDSELRITNMSKNMQGLIYSMGNSMSDVYLSPLYLKQNFSGTSSAPLKGESLSIDSSDIDAVTRIPDKTRCNENCDINIVNKNISSVSVDKVYNKIDDNPEKNSDFVRYLIQECLNLVISSICNSAQEADANTIVVDNKHLEYLPVSGSTCYRDVISLNVLPINLNLNNYVDECKPGVNDGTNDSATNFLETQQNITELEVLSFKSVTSVSILSEYFLAESSMGSFFNLDRSDLTSGSTSIQDIFERKPSMSLQCSDGAMALQAFSGFSMNTAYGAEEMTDLVNLIDSETGSTAIKFVRQTVSEEVLLSSRSSDSFATCVIDDDIIVPYWLFQIISQQSSVQEEHDDDGDTDYEEPDNLVLMPLPVVEPIFDVNGNIAEPIIGVSTGAGDGRGIHSDVSQDSSGNGSSLSSSVPSSPQSVAVIDPTSFTTPYEFRRVASNSSGLVSDLRVSSGQVTTSHMPAEGAVLYQEHDFLNSSGDPQCLRLGTSDTDADVSSTDTDIPDSSDN